MTPYVRGISSTYLEACMTEKVYIQVSPAFGNLEGHLQIMIEALYNLRLNCEMFNQLLAECLESLSFKRSLVDNNIFLRPSSCGTVYKNVVIKVYNLCIIAKQPNLLLEQLQGEPYNFNLKRTRSDQFSSRLRLQTRQ